MGQQQSSDKSRSIQLPDGRRLGYAEYGVPNGKPVLFFHGSLGSSHVHADMAEITAQREVRLIAVDRPGYGLSTPKHDRTFLNWADDIATLMDDLGIEHFSIIGFSGGTPYPLACAFRMPSRVQKIALVAPFAPLDAPGVMEGMSPMAGGLYALAQANPAELRATFAALAPTPSALLGAVTASVGEWEKKVLLNRAAEFSLEYAQILSNGTEGIASDYILFSGNWGFPIAQIKTEVHLWSGTIDQNTPPAMTNYLAAQLANSQVHTLQGEGHFVLYGHWDGILQSVL